MVLVLHAETRLGVFCRSCCAAVVQGAPAGATPAVAMQGQQRACNRDTSAIYLSTLWRLVPEVLLLSPGYPIYSYIRMIGRSTGGSCFLPAGEEAAACSVVHGGILNYGSAQSSGSCATAAYWVFSRNCYQTTLQICREGTGKLRAPGFCMCAIYRTSDCDSANGMF